ncbi:MULTISPECIES: TolC family outer membrane protein [unclassified Sphingomonas]|uniref:TolC family outer membrane protein n=1 Tax=unclassified Sphingomonas TaxID=196159 RepID=UPI002857C7DA|nr:TolC family outer membrane protein [Sphingomonas sp. SORGH_AS_0870]MDR6145985.1 outer membrane protein [Sphingomonas sp. SORGH_AS_0870]
MRPYLNLGLTSGVLIGAALLGSTASAETLREAMLRAYQSNPTITGQRAAQRATDENVPIARASGLPSLQSTGQITDNVVVANNNFLNPERTATGAVQLSVPLYQGGAVKNAVRAAETRVDAGRAQLRGVEANLFTNVVGAYMNVIRDEAIVNLNTRNVNVLETNLRASRDRFQVGDLTRTDVAQSEARLAQARAQLQSAQANLISSRENYINIVGVEPVGLEQPPALPSLPASPNAAVGIALDQNPQLIAARRSADATRYDIDVARANRLPRVSAVSSGNYFNYLGSLNVATVPSSGVNATVGLQLSMPLFQGGRPAAQVRQAEALRGQALENATATERQVVAQVRSAYAVWQSSQEVILSAESAVRANSLSLEGVRAENSVGTRTVLDILNAEQELLNSQVTLVTARRDAYVAGFALIAAMGNAEARDLGLDGGALYDPVANYKRVRNKINDWGGDGEPAPVASTTAGTPAQTAVITRPLDPDVNAPVDRSPALTTGASAPSRQ